MRAKYGRLYQQLSRYGLFNGAVTGIAPSKCKRRTSTPKALNISVDIKRSGDWIALARVRGKRVFFHRMPDARTVRKAFVVAGDVVYVTEEKPGWYHVLYGDGAKGTSGWIRSSDTAPL